MISLKNERKFGPFISEVSAIKIPAILSNYLDNEIPLYEVNMGTQDVIKFEWVFKAGRPFEQKQLAARATANQLKEGTKDLSSLQISEKIDCCGATLRCASNFDTASITLFCLKKHFLNLLPLIREIWLTASFPEDELEKFKLINQQNLKLALEKNDIIAYRELTSRIFGNDHPYGYNSFPASYAALNRNDLLQHYEQCYGTNNSFIILSGKSDQTIIQAINAALGQEIKHVQTSLPKLKTIDHSAQTLRLKNKDEYQAAIRMGRRLFTRAHPDYIPMYLLNTILGGYFGSRLMKSIREKKAYTYNIYSMLDSMWLDGYFYIHTEVGNEYVEATRLAIYDELIRLQEEQVPEKELKMVKNYLKGNILGMLDGPFKISKVLKSLILNTQDFTDFKKMVDSISMITSDDIQKMARKYFERDRIWELIVGP